ncbi:hypothetical protein CJO92_10925 [Ralstonia solanacearum]|uniref:Uncharacterized protein n=1 Tax=Ralstonia solanacearum TaxID=305 RepID=A0AAD0WHH4_RALSL|nr:hypothetical protein CJO77_10930 [Ralstonia solanacearum]AXW53137.1 hypothetical protein CJO92_10925 [Ralstonia solanacearum]
MAPFLVLRTKHRNQSGFQFFVERPGLIIGPILKQDEVINVPAADGTVTQAEAAEVLLVLLQVE